MMSGLRQAKLLLWKNVLLRYRYPATLALEVLWPVLMIGVVALMRSAVPPYRHGNCHYHPRAMPSAGAVPFLQTYLCNLDNRCYKSETELDNALKTSHNFASLSQDLGPYFSSDEVLDVLAISDQSVTVLETMQNVLGDKELMHGLESTMYIRNYFKDPQKVQHILERDFNMSPNVSEAIMRSQFNVAQLLNLTGTPDFRAAICEPATLGLFITFPKGVNVKDVSAALCGIQDNQLESFANSIIAQLNVSSFFDALKLFEQVKTNIGVYSLSTAFDSIARMFEVVMSSESFIGVLGDFMGIPNIADIIRRIPEWVDEFDNLESAMSSAKSILSALEPLMTSLGLEDSAVWLVSENAVNLGINFLKLGEGQWNGTSEEFIQPLEDLLSSLKNLTQSKEGQQLQAVMDFFSKVDWPGLYNEIIQTGTIDERTILHVLDVMEEMMKELPEYSTVQMMTRLGGHSLDIMAIVTEKSIELKHALKNQFESNGPITDTLNRLFQYGPDVIKGLLKAFRSSTVVGDLMKNATDYQSVCERVMEEMKSQLPENVYQDVHGTLCATEVDQAFTHILDSLKLTEISTVINSTVQDVTALYEGDFYDQKINFTSLYHRYVRFTQALNDYLYDQYTWEEVFNSITLDSWDMNMPGWESVADTLNSDFLTTGILGAYRGLGSAMASSRVSKEIGPYVHMMSEMSTMLYTLLKDVTTSYGSDSPLVEATTMFSQYLPEIVKGIEYMWENNITALYNLAASPDPLATFCGGKYMTQMNMPAYLPISEMNGLICDTNWTAVVIELSQPVDDIMNMIEKMTDLLEVNTTARYDVELDWIDLMDHTERVIDIISSGDIGNADFTMGYQAVVESLNFTQLFQGIELVFQVLGGITMEEDIEKLVTLVFKSLEQMENNEEFMRYMALVDAYMDMQIQVTDDVQVRNSLQGMIESYSPYMWNLTTQVAQAYPELIMALKNILLYPEKLIDMLLKDGFSVPDCNTHFVMDYTLLPANSSMHKLEKTLCEMNITAILEDLMTSQTTDAFQEKIADIISGDHHASVNWTELVDKTISYIKLLDSPMYFNFNVDEGFDLSPFNISAISMSWQEFYEAADSLKDFDMSRFQEVSFKLQQLLMGDSSNLTTALYSGMYVSHQFVTMINSELLSLNSSREVVLFEFLGVDSSPEMMKLRNLLIQSPEINAVGVATLERLLTHPEKAMVNTDFDELCTDLAEFSKVFVVEAASISPAVLQKTVCDVNINFNLLGEELINNRTSLKKLVDAMDVLNGPYSESDVKVNITEVIDGYNLMIQLVEDLIQHPPVIKVTNDESWMNMTLYSQDWERLGRSLSQLGTDLSNSSIMINWESALADLLFTTIEEIPEGVKVLGYLDVILDIMQRQLDETTDGLTIGSLVQYPNANAFLDLLTDAPEVIETALYTILTEPSKTGQWTLALQSWTDFCGTPTSTIFSVPPDLTFSMEIFVVKACSIDYDELIRELNKYQSVDRLEALLTNETYEEVNSSVVSQKLESLVRSLTDYIESPDSTNAVYLRLFNTTVWEQIGARIDQWSNITMNLSPEKISKAITDFAYTAFGDLSVDAIQIYKKLVGLTNAILDEVLHALESKTFSEAFESLSSVEFLVKLLNELPELFETLLYTSLHHNSKLSNGLSQVTSFESFCAIKPEELMVLAPNSTWNAKAWFDSLCSLNLTTIVDELYNSSLVYQVDRFFSNGTITGPDNISGIINKMEKIVSRLTEEGITTNERVFKANVWETVMTRINSWTLTPDVAIRSVESLLILVEEILDSNPSLHKEIRPFIVADAVAINLIDILLSVENKTHFGAADFFKGWTSMQKILELLQMPGSMDIILTSLSSSDHFLSLFSNMSALEDLCLPSTPTNKYLAAPDNALVNLQQFRTALCDIDFDGFTQQFNDYFDMDYLTRLANGTADFPWSELQIKMDRFTTMIERWTDNPPEFDLPDLWTNISYWTNLLSTDMIEQLSTKDQIESMLNQLGPLLDMDGFKQVGIVLNSVLDILNDNLVAMENASYTLTNAVTNIPALHDLFNAMGLNADTMTSLLLAPIKNATRFAELFLSNDFQGDFCSTDKWREIIVFPVDFNTSALSTAICAENTEPLVLKLKEAFSLESMIAALNDNSSHVQDWKDASEKIFKLVDNVKALIENPPSVTSDSTLEMLSDRYTNTTELWNMLAAFSALEQSFGNDTVFMGEFQGVTSVASVLLNFLDDILARIKVQHGRLDLASLFKDVPGFVQMVEGVLTIEPDPLTGLFSVQLKPSKVDTFTAMVSNSSQLEQLFCDKDIFQDVFLLRENVNISALLHVLCDLDFEVMEQQLKDSFKIGSLGRDLENAWTNGGSVDVEELVNIVENLIAHIENLTRTDQLMFAQHDLGDLLMLNVTRLMEALSGQFENMQNINAQDYVHISTSILNELLVSVANVSEVKTLTVALQFTQMYLHSFNTFLKSIKDEPISLASLLNTTEVGQILNPILTDPRQLDALADLNLDVRELSKILDSADPIDGLCSDDLWLAVLAPANVIQPLIDLQKRICSVNETVLLWQTIMVQANGYYLYKQMDVIEREINEGRRSLNVTAVGEEMTEFINLMSAIIEQYLDGSRTLNGLLDLNSFQQILDNTQRHIAEMLIDQASTWSVDIADILLPRLLEKPMLETMAKTLNTANLMMNLTIQHLQGLRDGTISTSSLFNNANGLVDLIEAYIRVGKNLAQSWLDDEFDLDKMVNLLKDMDQVKSLCSQSGGLTSHLTDQIPPSDTVKDMSVVICSVIGDSLTTEFQNFVNYTDIEEQLQAIWNGSDVSPHYRAFANNVEEFTNIIEELSNKSLTVTSSLTNTFDFGSTLKSLEKIATNPSMIFNLLKLLGLAIDGPMSKEPEAVQALAGMNTFVIMPMVNVLQALEGKGLSLETIVQDPDTMLDVLGVLLDFNTHSSVMETVVLKSMVNEIVEQRDQMCNSTSYENEMALKVSTLSLPVTWTDIYTRVCTSESSVLLKKLTDMGLTNVQIVIIFQKMLDQPDISTLPDMYNKDFSWMDLMSSLESMTKLLTLDKMNPSTVTHVKTTWNAVKDIVFDKSLNSLLQYLQLAESSHSDSESWITFKQFLRFFSSALDFVSSNVDKLGGSSTIQLQDVLPNSTHVASLIEDVFGTNSAAELLTTSIDPIMFYRMSLTNTWNEICGGGYALSDFFHFPVGTDMISVQDHLCKAVTTRSTSFEELLSLFDAKDMLTQLDMLVQGQFNSSAHSDTVFDAFHSAVMKLIHAGEAMQQGYVDPDSVDSWLQPILNTLSSLQTVEDSHLVAMCDSLVLYMNRTEGFLSARDTLSMVMTAMDLVTDMARVVPALDEVTCILLNGTSIDVSGAVDKLNSLGMWHNMEKALEKFLHPPLRLNCTAPLRANQMLMDVINSSIVGSGLDTVKMLQCLENTEGQFRDLIMSFSKTMSLFQDIMKVLQAPGVQEFLSNQDILPVLHFIFDNVSANQQGILALTDLITDKRTAGDYLVNSLGLPQSAVDSLLNASVNQDRAYFLTEPVQVLADILCDSANLSKVISLHSSSPTNMSELSAILCAQNVIDIAHFLKNISISGGNISQLVMDLEVNTIDVVTSMISHISEMVMDFEDIINLVIAFVDDFNLDTLRERVDIIDRVLQSNTLTHLAESMQYLLNDLKLLLPKEGDSRDFLDEISKIVDGILGLDLFKDMMMQSLQVKDLVKDPAYLTFYMTTQLGLNSSISAAIMDGTFSARTFLGLESEQPHGCDQVVEMLIILNSTQASMSDISQALCSLSQSQLTKLVTALTPELNIGHLVAKYVAYTGNVFLETANMNTTELNDMVETIDSSSVILQRATEIIEGTPNASQIIDIFYGGQAGAFVSLEKLTPAMCGGDVVDIFDTNFHPGIVLTSSDDIMADIERGIQDNQLDLPNEFCVEMYETIRNSGIGGILWSYLKPIIRGKILYTPDNAVTRAIVQKANGTFALLDEIHRVSSIWAKKSPNLLAMVNMINDTDDIRGALESEFVQGLIQATIGIDGNSLISSLDAVLSNNFDSRQLAGLQTAAEIIANYTSCISTDRFVPVASEEELEVMAFKESQSKTFLAGLVFMNTEEENTPSNRRKRQVREEIPKHVTYKIRMDVDNVMDTSRLKSHIWKMTAEDSFVEDMRYLRGFIYIQDMVDNAIIDLHKNEIYPSPGFRIRQMPFPCHHEDDFIFMLGSYLIPIMMTFVFLASLGVATHNLVSDKENGQEETLHVMGMVKGLNLFSWFISTMFIMMVVSLILAIMLKYTDIFIYSNILIMFLYLSDFCLSSVMLLYMVSSFFNRTTMAILFVIMVYLISYLPYILVIGLELNMHFWHKMVASLASTTAFSFGALSLAYLEESGTGVQWNNIDSKVMKDFSVHWACIMMLVDSGIYFLVGWYVRHVKPGKYGISQPWYFPVKPSFWSSCFSSGGLISSRTASSQASRPADHLFEERTGHHDVGIAVENLSKTYSNKKKALENLTVNFYKGEITSLLGHNGAAKSTTLNMICGVLEPTSGRVLINGNSAGCCKPTLGVCPQQNALFNYMTVLEHMKLYAGMKGAADTAQTRTEMAKLLRDVDLWHHRSTSVGNLSYGTKRRLCVALAFVGGSDTVVLDEPTSGVDPHARKNIWNLITKNRPGRTILLSTHHLDEADILSDQIAIMHEGKLLCCGSPAFLKNSLGGGFQLTVVKKNEDNQAEETQEVMDLKSKSSNSAILSYIQTMCPQATLVEEVGLDLTFNLPKDESSMKVSFYQFFRQLEEFCDQLGIANFGLSDTTLEEIFLQLTEEANTSIDEGVINPVMTSRDRTTLTLNEHSETSSDTNNAIEEKIFFAPAVASHSRLNGSEMRGALFNDETSSVDLKKRQSGLALTCSQVMALLIKRFHHYRRNWRMLLTCALLPLIGFFIAMAFTAARPDEAEMTTLVLDPAIYGPEVYSFYSNAAKNQEAYRFSQMLTGSSVGIGTTCMEDFANEYFDENTCLNPSPWMDNNYTINLVVCSNARQVYQPLKINMSIPEKRLPSEQYIQNLENWNIPSYILRTFRDFADKRFGGWSFEPSQDGSSIEVDPYVWFNSKGYHAMPSFLNSLSNTVLRSHLPSGQDPTEYGITAMSHPIKLGRSPLSISTMQKDAADAGIALMLVVSFSLIPGGFIVYIISEKIHKQRQLQNISGVGLLTYWLVAFMWDLFIYMISVAVAAAMVAIIQPDAFFLRQNLSAFVCLLLLYGWSIIPCLYCLSRIFQQGSTAFLVTFCLNLFIALITVISLLVMQLFQESDSVREAYKVCKYVFLIFPQYALGQGLMDLVSNIFKYKIFLRFGENIYESPYSRDVIGWNLIALAIQGGVFFILTLIMDTIVHPPISLPKESKVSSFDTEDADVIREKNRIQQGPRHDLLVVDNLTKVYRRGLKKFLAVDHISFGVPPGESFGLLGVNGAGKTTTFRMLTGDLKPAGGAAFLKGHALSANDRHFGQDVGYCPQEGGLDEYLTGSETLHFHSRLRGFDSQQRNEIVNELLSRLQLTAYAHKAVHTYSGGTRRKLALAVALLGEPPILYLDEPTTGMDAGTRRLAWSCIARAKRNGQAVVLTSHTMDECGALCSRIAIMVNGQIKCIGSPQHLKHKFGKGYTVMMHTSQGSPRNVAHAFMNRFPGSVIKSEHINSTQLQVPQDSGSVADIIAALQKAEDDGIIQYYSISQTTLDAVFVSFVQDQQDGCDEENLVNESSFSDSSDTPSGSISSKSPPSSTSWPRKKSESNYVFTNPQFVPDDVRPGFVPDGRNYSNNIVFGARQPEVSVEDVNLNTKL